MTKNKEHAKRIARLVMRIGECKPTPFTERQRFAVTQILEAYFDKSRTDQEAEDYATLIANIYEEQVH